MKLFGFLDKIKQQAYQLGYAKGRHDESVDQTARRDEFYRVEKEFMVGKPVIAVPNEWTNPVIGFVSHVDYIGHSPVLWIDDEIRGEKRTCGGVIMGFSYQRLDMALTLDPYQLWAITAHNSVDFGDFEKPHSGERWSKEKIMDKLREGDFFERWEAFERDYRNS